MSIHDRPGRPSTTTASTGNQPFRSVNAMMPGDFAVALQTEQTRRAGVEVGRDSACPQRGECVFTLLQLCGGERAQLPQRRRKGLLVEIGNHVRLIGGA